MRRARRTWRWGALTRRTSATARRWLRTRKRSSSSEVLADYADYLAAECLHAENNDKAAEALLRGFDERYPDTIFDIEAPELESNVLLAQGDATAAQRTLQTVADEAQRHA